MLQILFPIASGDTYSIDLNNDMRSVRSIFEGIFDGDQKSVETAAKEAIISQMASDPNNEFFKKLFRGKCVGELRDNVLTVNSLDFSKNVKPIGDYNPREYFDIEKLSSSNDIFIKDLTKPFQIIDGRKFIPCLQSDNIFIYAKVLKNIKLMNSLQYDNYITLGQVELLENVYIESKRLFIDCRDSVPKFRNVNTNEVRNLTISFQNNDITNELLNKIIDLPAMLKKANIRKTKSIKRILIEMPDALYDNLVVRDNIDFIRLIEGSFFPKMSNIFIAFKDFDISLRKNPGNYYVPVANTGWYIHFGLV